MPCRAFFDKDYLSPEKCTYVKGFFTIFILLSHYMVAQNQIRNGTVHFRGCEC